MLDYLTRFPFLGKRQIAVEWKILFRINKVPVTEASTATIKEFIEKTKKAEKQIWDKLYEVDLKDVTGIE